MEFSRDNLELEREVTEKRNYEKELQDIVKSGDSPGQIKEKLSDYHNNDIAAVWSKLSKNERIKLHKILGNEIVSDIFSYMEDDITDYLEELGIENATDIIENMDADDAVDVLEEMDRDKAHKFFGLLDEDAKKDIAMIHRYDDDKIGSKMTTNYVAIPKGFTVTQAMKSLVEQAADNDNISIIYVLDSNHKLYGELELKDLIVSRKYTDLDTLISTSCPYVYDDENVTDCIEKLKDYSEDSIPVLSTDNVMLGVITSQDIVEVIDEELGDDYAKFAGLTSEEDLKETLSESMKKRVPWLLILLLLGLVVSTVVGLFEHVVSQVAIVVSFQSLILGMAGNTGTQSLAVTIRVLMDENLNAKQKIKLIIKEVKIGFSNGIILAAISLIFVGIYIWLVKKRTFMFAFAVSGCIGISLIVAMMISSFMGTIIPIFFKKINVDPAVASGPLITTVNDLVAVVTYYGLAWLLLIDMLHLV